LLGGGRVEGKEEGGLRGRKRNYREEQELWE
jgi:hypothetical protein